MILNISNIDKAFGDNQVLRQVSFHIEEHEKAALVGVNGAGKSTLLKIIMGLLSPDSGSAVLQKDRKIGYLAQHQDLDGDNTIYEQLLTVRADLLLLDEKIRASEQRMASLSGDALEEEMKSYARMSEEFERQNGYAYKSEVTGVLKGLGFAEEEFGKRVGTLSGGQKTRVALGKLLLTAPDIILLDEPTNHLDMHSIEWLETYLLNLKGAVLIVSHDRYFLNRVVTKVIELENGGVRVYSGNYDAFSEKKAAIRRAEYAAYINAERERQRQEAVIEKLKSFNREKSIRRAESREKLLSKMDQPDRPAELDTKISLRFTPRIESGNDVLRVEGLRKAFGSQLLFEDLHFELFRGEHVALIGNNGTGKSTILKILNGVQRQDAGSVIYGSRVESGYYDQEMHVLHMEKTIFEEISDAFPYLTNTEIRSALAAFLFTGDNVFKRISSLSGGEQARVSLCRLMLSDANLIFLDEPTNHLDIESREILESALRAYEGTVFYVSHDRYFINRTATRILDLTHGQLLNYIGNYDYYLEKKEDVEKAYLTPLLPEDAVREETQAKTDWKQQKEEQARIRKQKNDLARIEERIGKLEAENETIDGAFLDPETASDPEKLLALSRRKAELEQELEEAYEKWEALQ